jgi:hypothetical protein
LEPFIVVITLRVMSAEVGGVSLTSEPHGAGDITRSVMTTVQNALRLDHSLYAIVSYQPDSMRSAPVAAKNGAGTGVATIQQLFSKKS